jgi:hypothetical protein
MGIEGARMRVPGLCDNANAHEERPYVTWPNGPDAAGMQLPASSRIQASRNDSRTATYNVSAESEVNTPTLVRVQKTADRCNYD